jgi:C-terminal processing protease CtpA/Prc
VNYLINELKMHGDNHSFLMSPADVKGFGVGDIMGKGRQVETEYLGDGIGYIAMPGFATLNDSIRDAFASNTQKLIKKIDAENKICGWIVDLRYDDGGSCGPMVAGLGPILGEGMFDMNISVKNDTSYSYYKNGSVYGVEKGKIIPESSVNVLKPYKLKNEKLPVAVLIGPRCGSSGECAVAAFIGRKDTKLFGKPTAGFTKGNSDYTLADGSMLFIASTVQSDRNGKKYPDRIFPDVEVGEPANSKDDVTLNRAKQWLVSFGICK